MAINDAMGWFDYHLHHFEIKGKGKQKVVYIGIPDFDRTYELRERIPRSSAARVSEHNKNKQLIDDSSQLSCEESQLQEVYHGFPYISAPSFIWMKQ